MFGILKVIKFKIIIKVMIIIVIKNNSSPVHEHDAIIFLIHKVSRSILHWGERKNSGQLVDIPNEVCNNFDSCPVS